MWTFGKKIAVGFLVSFVLLLVVGLASYRSIQTLAQTSYKVSHSHAVLEQIVNLQVSLRDAETGQRGYVLTGIEGYLAPYNSGHDAAPRLIATLREMTQDNKEHQQELAQLLPLVEAKMTEMQSTIDMRRQQGLEATAKYIQQGRGRSLMDEIRVVLARMDGHERVLLKQRADDVEDASADARDAILVGTVLSLVFVVVAGTLITRSLASQITTTVRHVQQSSAELQAAATQQASGARESATSMAEITTTISELLASSRQIAESAQRVVGVAEQTLGAARSGEGNVARTSELITSMRQQVELIVGHMLDLGKKSQQIGTVLDVVSELAEQTNILAINATIEANGAGDAGRRFAAVADEIRKLADRVGGSTKEIRALIDDVRGAVNTTVMATETGAKAVDAGARQFLDVASSLGQISSLMSATTDAAREIELSTKQQSTAVEQVNAAIASTAQATREAEASSTQTFETASQLAGLSSNLLMLVQAKDTH